MYNEEETSDVVGMRCTLKESYRDIAKEKSLGIMVAGY